jgi:O-antigen ligase
MPPLLALLLWFVLLLALLRFDPAKEPGISPALWVSVIWIFFVGSRLPSQWLGGGMGHEAELMEQGNALDRYVQLLLILLALGTLLFRSFEWGKFFAANAALTALLAFGLLSVLWSDFPFVAFKRWFKDLGTYLAILVALTDPRPFEALRTLVRRACFLLIPLSILLIKYFPEMGKQYNSWTGEDYFIGVTTSKNMLGVLCLVSGLFFFWDLLTRWRERKERRTARILLVDVAFLAMTLWLLSIANSATSSVCLALGCAVIAAAHSKTVKRRPALLTVSLPVGICLYLLLQFAFDINIIAMLAEAVGRSPDLTGRTDIWNAVLSIGTNPLVGAGYESFWLGSRLRSVWEKTGITINEAHNGFLEVYLNQGLIGLFLLAGFLVVSYRTICRRVGALSSLGSLSLALWTVLLFYNVTESAFRNHLMWVALVLGVIAVPGFTRRLRNAEASEEALPRSAPAGRPGGSARPQLPAVVGAALPRRPDWPPWRPPGKRRVPGDVRGRRS